MQALLLMIALGSPAANTTPLDWEMPAPATTAAPTRVALNSLKELFHGKQEPQKKALPPKQRATITFATGVAREVAVEAFLNAFTSGLMARDASGLEALVAKNYAIDGLPASVAPTSVLRQAIEQSPGPVSIEVKSVSSTSAGTTATTEFRYEKGQPRMRTIKLDSTGKLVWSDLFAVTVKTHGETG